MSLVYITYHNENIFDVDNDEKSESLRRRGRHGLYVSKFKKQVRQQVQQSNVIELDSGKKILTDSNRCHHKTMGYAETPLDPPCAFLRKNQGVKWQRFNDHVCPKGRMMPPVPRYERPVATNKPKTPVKETIAEAGTNCPHRRYFKNHKHRANFIQVNVERIKTSMPKRPPPRYVDTPVGERHNLLNTGLIPQYICSKNFGKVPCYLRIQKKMLENMRERCQAERKQQEDKCMGNLNGGIRQLTANERFEILAGLRTNFSELSKMYQGLSLYTDTISKKLRKGKLEKDLRQLEQDIYLMESNPVIFISEY